MSISGLMFLYTNLGLPNQQLMPGDMIPVHTAFIIGHAPTDGLGIQDVKAQTVYCMWNTPWGVDSMVP